MSFFRKFINVGFWVCFVVCLIGVLIGSIAGFCIRNMEWLGLVILVGGGLTVTTMFAMFGMFIELCNNIAEIEKNVRTFKNSNNTASINNSNNTTATISKLQAINANGVLEDFWFCKACGEKNDRLGSYCQNCGRYK